MSLLATPRLNGSAVSMRASTGRIAWMHVPDQLMCHTNANPATGVGSSLSCLTINARLLSLPVMRYFRYLLKRTCRVNRSTDEPVENCNQINNLANSGSSQITDSGSVLAAQLPTGEQSKSSSIRVTLARLAGRSGLFG